MRILRVRASSYPRRRRHLGRGFGALTFAATVVVAVAVMPTGLAFAKAAAPPANGTPISVQTATGCDAHTFTCASEHAFWDGSLRTLKQKVTVRAIGASTFLPLAWSNGYIGVQRDGNSVSGVTGPTALFSVNGSNVRIGTVSRGVVNPNCEAGFDTEPRELPGPATEPRDRGKHLHLCRHPNVRRLGEGQDHPAERQGVF